MAIQPTWPGVYVEEVASGVRTITGVSTSITAFIGRAFWGQINEPVMVNNFGEYERKFGGLWQESTMSFAVKDFFMNGGTQAIIVRLINGASKSTLEMPAGADPLNLIIETCDEGSWGNDITMVVDYNTKDINLPAPDPKLFNLSVIGKQGQTENFLNISVDPASPKYIPKVLEQRSNLIRIQKNVNGSYETPGIRPDANEYKTIDGTKAGDGDNLNIVQYTTGPDLETKKEGLFSLEKADIFNLLCIPPYSPAVDIGSDLISSSVTYCIKRRAVLIVDPPSDWTNKEAAENKFTAAANSFPGISSNYAALYFPRLKQPNPLRDNLVEEFVPCGAVAGIIARTDSQRGVWKAPAGQDATLTGVPELSVSLTDNENGDLNQLGINCLRAFPVYGRLIWGARTLEGADRLASEWKYLPVRRTALFIEESLYRGLKWVVFEPNDEPLWAQIRLNVGAFMHNLFIQDAFQGQTPKDAYFVKCDKETTTQNDINLGIVNIWVGFAPLKPAEFVILHIQQMAGKINQ